MFDIIGCITNDHDPWMVGLAATICLLGLTALYLLLVRAEECIENRRRSWTAIAALTAGLSIWSTHFLAMLAYRGRFPIDFDLWLTMVSAAVPVAGIWAALTFDRHRQTRPVVIVTGLILSFSVAAMHFVGMNALIVQARIHYDGIAIAQALAIGTLFLTLSICTHRRLGGWARIIVPVALGALGIVTLHFGAMGSTTLIPGGVEVGASSHLIERHIVSRAVIIAMALIVLTMIAAAVIDRLLTDLRGLTGATREGIAILKNGRIIEANPRLATLLGTTTAQLIRSRPEDWLEASDGAPLMLIPDRPAEARPHGVTDCCLEIATHEIEYRGRRAIVLAIRDLTEERRAQRQIAFMAVHDPLTRLPNRAYFSQALETAITQADQKGPFALLALDLDRFKAVNDLFGHAAGDSILCRVASILTDAVDEASVVARVGGDEFLILQRGIDGAEKVQRLTETILSSFAAEMDLSRDPMAVGVSIGVSLFPKDAADADTLRQNADVALYRAKMSGRGTASFFDHELDQTVRNRRALEHDLRHALLRDQMRLVYQPLVATGGAAIIGYEALLRWEHPERGEVVPDDFVPIAEDTGIILQLGEWVLREACRTAASWPAPMTLAVNVSPIQFQIPNLPEIVSRALIDSGLAAGRLELEITENVLLHNRESTLKTLHALKAIGVGIVMDDFGTGYSSLSNLRCFPFDKIKIDRSFISGVTDDEAARSIVRAIVGLGRSLNLPVVAEGVETVEQHRMVLEEGCPQAQGFLFGCPGEGPVYAAPSALRRRP
ncbi:diguanylate cyclase domain protein [Sphingomonas sp. S17]|uniref:EAL domain-containing protein n=2 Tax=Sphingomonas paucimobilis TaxID=13689 RepID=A0A7T3E5W4_SPHPI|nr:MULTISPECIES: EAL domain-containing protein [Sphingomonas]EGI56841.1 diguanylate cyclase domain protein [Sphingomonas sp. S17]MBQ1480085.1 EAL domain-containing protein [Sphingomonas sp.]MCM3679012.1 EAL domain-containing protein [Sphingomonas paucimobilis]MDG5971766.1 EAL domain-containing protein [Sphingomonas paucimobilis]QBE91259.1 EAL domain-containing protein [Sphingomonas paucimobilis]